MNKKTPQIEPSVKNFKNFLYLAWQHLNLPNPTPIQYDIADYLQNGSKRIVIEAFRGVGKSWITSAFVCHQLLLNPQRNILVVSASKNRADDFSTFTQRLISEMPLLNHLKPREDQRHSKVSFDVAPARASHAPSVKSLGVTSQLTGSRADLIIADDVESANNSQTQLMRDRLGETVKEFDAIIKPEVGRIVFLGTPQTEMSLYNDLEERGFQTRVWTALYPTPTQQINLGNKLAPTITEALKKDKKLEGKPTDPQRFDEVDLMERQASYGRSGFALQFMLDTTLSDLEKYPLKLNDLIVVSGLSTWKEAPAKIQWASSTDQIKNIDSELPNVGLKGDYYVAPMYLSEEYAPFEGSVMAIDPAGRGADRTGFAVVKMLHGILYVTACGGLIGGYSDTTLEELATIAKHQNVNYVVLESNFGDGMATALLKPIMARIHPCSIEEVRHSKQKELRIIDTLEPVMNQHRLVVSQELIKDDFKLDLDHQLFKQMTRITKDKGSIRHDDQLDALSIAVNYWVERMDRDQELSFNEHKNDLLRQDLDRFMENAVGQKPSNSRWFN
ncbi:terminase large subunit [uncultured phage_MedDCM-OCT-S42-C7]|uniref:Terminase, large subunit n=1 Tax=uncultured phage_MedDCM-OCT-S42-C7 TaxID=2741073 RepID=A0A6S4PG31_9CAUD|nr:terminase large subunit [uncultured phage_MedDCM-OCT-S42-C7]BAQ94133.1 terminase large subunit [uncultured phage_MedDCM-OCT-S42-C7]